MKIPFHRPSITTDEEHAILSVLRSGWLTSGEVAEQLENEFGQWLGAHAVAVASASAGLELVYLALARRGIREVVVPSLTFTSTAMGAIRAGLRCRFVDVSEQSLCMDPEVVASLESDPEVAVCAVHYGGYSDPELRTSLQRYHALGNPVVEDAAHALPTSDHYGFVGSGGVSTASVFSFYANKTVTSGEGGVIAVGDSVLAEELKQLRQHGINKSSYFRRFKASHRSWDYDVSCSGFKANLPDLLASLALVQFRRRFNLQQMRMRVALQYFELLEDSGLTLPPGRSNLEAHSWHLFVVRLPKEIERDRVMSHLLNSGIGCSLHYRPLHRHSYYQRAYSLDPADFPVSEEVFGSAISLPIYPDLNQHQVEEVVTTLLEALGR